MGEPVDGWLERDGVGLHYVEWRPEVNAGGERPLLLLQSSGFGNTLNAFGTLALPYQVPFLIILSPRGILGERAF